VAEDVGDAAAARDDGERVRDLAAVDVRREVPVEPGEPLRIQADLVGVDLDLQLGDCGHPLLLR
jgi:hypothetical protein